MTTIRLIDARRELNLKCRELFKDEKIAEAIYRYLCDGIEECEDAQPTIEPERKKGKWIGKPIAGYCTVRCSVCNDAFLENSGKWNFCPNCGCDMGGGNERS